MTRLEIRSRFALLAALLVFAVGSLVALAGYFSLRDSLLHQAARQARDQVRQLAALVDVPAAQTSGDPGRNLVDLTDPSLTHEFARAGLIVRVARADGRIVQSTRGASSVAASDAARARCLGRGEADWRRSDPPLVVWCGRVGPPGAETGMILAGAPLADVDASLARLRTGLAVGLAVGMAGAAAAALALARRALRPAREIAATAASIRSGDLSRRIAYEGPRDELGALADVLDSSFAELEEAVEGQRRFVADASHELKTPVAAVRAHVDLLRRWAAVEPPARDAALTSLDQAARRMARLVADLLYLTELDRPPPAARLHVSLDEVLLGVVTEVQPLRPDVHVRLSRLDEVAVDGDELRLQQLLLNLLDNALRVSPREGEVTVALRRAGPRVEITIADQGPGIPADRLERIFDRFYRAAAADGTAAGAGLGLAIARGIARAHGGDLTAANAAGGGAMLSLWLPLAGSSPSPHRALTDLSSRRPTVGTSSNPDPKEDGDGDGQATPRRAGARGARGGAGAGADGVDERLERPDAGTRAGQSGPASRGQESRPAPRDPQGPAPRGRPPG